MEQVVPADAGMSKWRVTWLDGASVVLLCALLGLVAGGALAWLPSAIAATPLAIVAAVALFSLPGLALLRLLWPDALSMAERWAFAASLSLIVPPLLFLVSSLIGLEWNSWLCWLLLVVCGLVAFWPRSSAVRRTEPIDRTAIILVVLTALALLVRLFVVRDLPVGMFGDSYHHTLITQLLVDHGGLFRSWEPYAPLTTFTYHYGFHSGAAWLTMLSGLPPAKSMLAVGQIESALVVPVVFLFTRRLTGNAQAALWAAVAAGFVSIMPAYYVNWGRYTQLAGQTILPAACVAWMALLDNASKPSKRADLLRLLVLAALTTTGVIVAHYRVAVFVACFVAAYSLYLVATTIRQPKQWLPSIGYGLAAGVLGGALSLPWLLRLREGILLRIGSQFISKNIGTEDTNALASVDQIIRFYIKPEIFVLALCGLGLLLWRRQWITLVLPLWAALVWLAANPYLLGLPGAGLLTNNTVLYAAYLLAAPLAGTGIALGIELVSKLVRAPNIVAVAAQLAMIVLVVWGINWQKGIIDTGYQLVTNADIEAAAWIDRELPADAKLYVNCFPAFGSLFAGSDAGWWLPYLAHRSTNLQPITYGSEAAEQPNYIAAMRDMNRALLAHPLASPEGIAALRAAGYEYLYDGAAASGLPAGITEQVTSANLDGTEAFEAIYRKDGVTIWKVR